MSSTNNHKIKRDYEVSIFSMYVLFHYTSQIPKPNISLKTQSTSQSPKSYSTMSLSRITDESLKVTVLEQQPSQHHSTKIKFSVPRLRNRSETITIRVENKEPEFSLFPKLPLELRRAIWQFSLPVARCITIETRYRPVALDSRKIYINTDFSNRSNEEEDEFNERNKESELDEDEELRDEMDEGSCQTASVGRGSDGDGESGSELGLSQSESSEDDHDSIESANTGMFWSPICVEKVPSIFFSCQEAKSVVEERYEPLKGNDGSGAVWCDPGKDIFCLADSGYWIPMDFCQLPDSIRVNITHSTLR